MESGDAEHVGAENAALENARRKKLWQALTG